MTEHYPVESSEEAADGHLRVRMRVGDEAWLRRLVLRGSGQRDRARAARAGRTGPRRGLVRPCSAYPSG